MRAQRAIHGRAAKRDETVYPTVYPEEDRVGEEILQRWIVELLRPLVASWLASRGERALVGADQFVYFTKGDVRRRVAPDVFVLPGVEPDRRIRSWKVWEERVVPSFALEVVSSDVDKDYIVGPALYRELGVDELVVFDPDFAEEPGRRRFQVFRRMARRGLVRTTATDEDRVSSRVLGCWIRCVGEGETTRLRIASGPEGKVLFPTEAERERERRIAAEAEVARLEALLRARKP